MISPTLTYLVQCRSSKGQAFLSIQWNPYARNIGIIWNWTHDPFSASHLPPEKTFGTFTNFFHPIFLQEADLALADLSVTPQRSRAVDFSVPFQTFASTIVTKVTKISTFSCLSIKRQSLKVSPFPVGNKDKAGRGGVVG